MAAKGLLTDEEVEIEIVPLRAEKARWQAAVTLAGEDTKVVELHPQAVERFRSNLEELSAIITEKDGLPTADVVETFRELVEAVVVQPTKVREEYEVAIRGHLAGLLGSEVSAIPMVAEERFLRSPPNVGVPFAWRDTVRNGCLRDPSS